MNANSTDNDWITGNITLTVGDAVVDLEMTVPVRPVKPQRMLPVIQKMASAFIDAGVAEVAEAGKEISCRAGCGACCRQAVPLAAVEAYSIAELVAQMPEAKQREVREKFADGYRRMKEKGWFARMDDLAAMSIPERMETLLEYFHENIECPFLENDSCSIHPVRPLVCREYLVTSPAVNCSDPAPKMIDKIDFKITSSRALFEFGRAGADSKFFVPLIAALEWTTANPENFAEKSGQQWMEEYFRELVATHRQPTKAALNENSD